MASALEALLKEVFEEPESITPSSLRTIGLTLEFLLLELAVKALTYVMKSQIETNTIASVTGGMGRQF